MQEVVELKLTVSKIETAKSIEVTASLTFIKIYSLRRPLSVTTDKLLISEEAVRALDRRE